MGSTYGARARVTKFGTGKKLLSNNLHPHVFRVGDKSFGVDYRPTLTSARSNSDSAVTADAGAARKAVEVSTSSYFFLVWLVFSHPTELDQGTLLRSRGLFLYACFIKGLDVACVAGHTFRSYPYSGGLC